MTDNTAKMNASTYMLALEGCAGMADLTEISRRACDDYVACTGVIGKAALLFAMDYIDEVIGLHLVGAA